VPLALQDAALEGGLADAVAGGDLREAMAGTLPAIEGKPGIIISLMRMIKNPLIPNVAIMPHVVGLYFLK
jgi:hypothetical protein